MSTLKDVQFAMNGEPQPKVPEQEDYIPAAKMKDVIKGKDDKNNKMIPFKLVKKNVSGVYIQAIDYVIDPKDPESGLQMIRLLKGVPSIWEKDQKHIPANQIGKMVETLEWPKGSRFMFVPAYDKARLQFMELCCHNRLNEHRTKGSKTEFFKYDPEVVEKEKTAAAMREIDLLIKASKQSFEKMKKHAIYLGIRLTHTITGTPKTEEALRGEYLLRAKQTPEEFEKSFDSKDVDVYYKIQRAIEEGFIDISRGDRKAYWGKDGGVICVLPKSEQPRQYLTQLALTNSEEGKEFKQELERLIT